MLQNAFPGGLVPVVGNSSGGLTNVGFDTSAVAPNRKTYYDQQWMYGFQYAPTSNDVIDLTYVGNHSVHVLASGLNLNQLDPKYFSMGAALLNQVPNPFFGHHHFQRLRPGRGHSFAGPVAQAPSGVLQYQ